MVHVLLNSIDYELRILFKDWKNNIISIIIRKTYDISNVHHFGIEGYRYLRIESKLPSRNLGVIVWL